MAHDYRGRDQDPAGRTTATGSPAVSPGKHTLVESLFDSSGATTPAPVQRKDSGPATGGSVHEAAQRGVADGGSRLPYLDRIQRLFGAHDVSNVQAHTSDAATRANAEIGARGYATGNHVAFAGTPDLHTAAHEAAHVVQQRAGVHLKHGVGETGDVYERHADVVADLVVQGRSAETLLDQHADGGGAHGAVQRQPAPGSGPTPTPAADPFEHGTFLGWPMIIVPDGYRGRLPRTNWIYRRYKVEFEALYQTIESGSARLHITETGPDGTAYAGFRDKILKAIKRLMTVVPGRQLIKNIEDGGSDVTIQPDPGARASANFTTTTNAGLRNADGTAGAGATSTISIDPNQSNRTQRAFDRDGNEISFPLFINLGHEMIHAMHNQRGENEMNNAPTEAEYDDREEELTIDGPGVSENSLRRSFGLTERHGHGIAAPSADSTATVSGGPTGG